MAGRLKKAPMTRRDAADAARLQKLGENGDTVLAHINPAEARLLDYLADEKIDAPRNPRTGLLSFGMTDGESGGFGGSSGQDSNPGGVGGGPAGGNTGGGIGGNTDSGTGGRSGGYGDRGYAGSRQEAAAKAIGDYYRDNYINGLLDSPYAAKDTWARVLQEYFNPSIKAPGRFSPPTAQHPGLMRGFIGQITPSVMGMPAFGVAMGIGGAMGRASSPATQAASAAEMAERGAMNSGGNQGRATTAQELDAIYADMAAARTPGGRSGAATAGLLGGGDMGNGGAVAAAAPAGFTVNPAGQLVPVAGNRRSGGGMAWRDPVRNMLMDYVLNGRSGDGLF